MLEEFLKTLDRSKLPKHIGLILDGNRRWAKKNKKDMNYGHFQGYEAIKKILYNLFDVGIKYLSIYALSSENVQKRTPEELEYIYKIIKFAVDAVKKEPIVKEERVKFNVIGRIWLLPLDVRKKIEDLIEYTKDHDQNFINLCLMYDGHEEITDAVKKILKSNIKPEDITPDIIKKNLYTHEFPELDYIIRTGMDDGARISGFLLWDASYAEFKFRNEYWPDYNEEMLIEDLKDYIQRNRRKGV